MKNWLEEILTVEFYTFFISWCFFPQLVIFHRRRQLAAHRFRITLLAYILGIYALRVISLERVVACFISCFTTCAPQGGAGLGIFSHASRAGDRA